MKKSSWSLSDKFGCADLLVAIISGIGTYLALFTPEFRQCIGLDPGDCKLSSLFKTSQNDTEKGHSEPIEQELTGALWSEVPGSSPANPDSGPGETLVMHTLTLMGFNEMRNLSYLI